MPTTFPDTVTDFWLPHAHPATSGTGFAIVVDASLRDDLALTLLSVDGGPRILTASPPAATTLSLSDGGTLDIDDLRERMAAAGLELNGADHLFYLPVGATDALLSAEADADVRALTPDDAAEFERFCAEAPAADLDEAFVELDHWLVRGVFAGDRLVAAASAYPWRETRLADIGVITLPGFRGKGFGRRGVRALAAGVVREGYQPQFRCQLDNVASAALARAAGFVRFGEWDVAISK